MKLNKMTAPMETSGTLPIYCFFRLALLYCKLYPWTLKNSTPEDRHGKKKYKSETPTPSAKKKKQKKKTTMDTQKSPANETLRPIRNASEISASFDWWNGFCILVNNCCCFSRYHARTERDDSSVTLFFVWSINVDPWKRKNC